MPYGVPIVRTVEELRRRMQPWRAQGLRTALVPTMGALHDGHVELVGQGLRRADRIVVSIFVNPAQFGPNEDFELYPRDERADAARLAEVGAHLIFAPEPVEIYPESFCTTVSVAGPAKAGLEDRFRPHFFDGVTTIVAKLFIQAGCNYAVFGEKDYQQLALVRRMVVDLDWPYEVVGVPTVREPDGLAMSSRNRYLSAAQRAKATSLSTALRAGEAAAAGGGPAVLAAARRVLEAADGVDVDYLELRDPDLGPAPDSGAARLLVAARVGTTRLIDNIGFTLATTRVTDPGARPGATVAR
jgi:pantoate--beta-alanine ligase